MSDPAAGLFDSLRRLLGTAVDIVQVRLELLGTEFEQEKRRLVDAFVMAALALLLLGLALVMAIGFVVLLFQEGYRLAALGVLTLLFATTGAWLLRRARAGLLVPDEGLFALSLGELRRDRDALAGTPAPPRPPR